MLKKHFKNAHCEFYEQFSCRIRMFPIQSLGVECKVCLSHAGGLRWQNLFLVIVITFTYFTCSPKFNLKSDNDLQFTKSAGSEFHSVIDLGKKENLKTSLETFGILYLKAWLLHVLNSLFGIKCSSVFMSTRLWLSLYIKVNLFFFRLVSNVSHFRSDNMSVTLAVLEKFWRQKRAAFLWTLSKVEISFL